MRGGMGRFPARDVFRDGTFSGTGRFPGWDVFRDGTFSGMGRFPGRDVQRHVYLSYLSRSVYMERMFAWTFFVPSWKTGFLTLKFSCLFTANRRKLLNFVG